MKTIIQTKLLIPSGLAVVAFAFSISSPAGSQPAAPGQGQGKPMKERCEEMMEWKEEVMLEMKAQDTALLLQVEKMNEAAAGEKVEEVAAAVTLVANQRVARLERLEEMHDKMSGHMMAHMRHGGDGAMTCPMMKAMMEKKSKANGAGAPPAEADE